MKKMIMNWIVTYLASTVTEEKVKEWMSEAKANFIPIAELWSKKLLDELRPKVLESETKIDDAGFKALEVALGVLIAWLKK